MLSISYFQNLNQHNNSIEEASIIRALKPSFGNSLNAKYRLLNRNGLTYEEMTDLQTEYNIIEEIESQTRWSRTYSSPYIYS